MVSSRRRAVSRVGGIGGDGAGHVQRAQQPLGGPDGQREPAADLPERCGAVPQVRDQLQVPHRHAVDLGLRHRPQVDRLATVCGGQQPALGAHGKIPAQFPGRADHEAGGDAGSAGRAPVPLGPARFAGSRARREADPLGARVHHRNQLVAVLHMEHLASRQAGMVPDQDLAQHAGRQRGRQCRFELVKGAQHAVAPPRIKEASADAAVHHQFPGAGHGRSTLFRRRSQDQRGGHRSAKQPGDGGIGGHAAHVGLLDRHHLPACVRAATLLQPGGQTAAGVGRKPHEMHTHRQTVHASLPLVVARVHQAGSARSRRRAFIV
eukprot:Opistho-1_new@42260